MQSSRLGIQIAGYRIEGKLGEGGMGTVYGALELNYPNITTLHAFVLQDENAMIAMSTFRAKRCAR